MFARVPSIVVEDAALAPSKRRRLEPRALDNLVDAEATTHSRLEPAAESPAVCPGTKTSQQICDDSLICFGMVVDRPVMTLSEPAIAPSCPQKTVFFTPPRELRCCISEDLIGQLDNYAGEVLSRLVADDELLLQLTFSASPIALELDTKPPKGAVGFLSIIIYGPKYLFRDVGDFMTKCNYYLHNPTGCDRNVPYMNPQCLFSLYEHPPMTFDLPQVQRPTVDDLTRTPSDILGEFETTDCLAEAATPTALRTALHAHQRQALTFFLRRELGLHPSEDDLGIWSRQPNAEGNYVFVNTITKQTQSTPPPVWRGGLLADQMGLGKTLSIIALVASDQDRVAENSSSEIRSPHADELHSTLIVVPPGVLEVWEYQLKRHVYAGRLTWFSHLGRNRLQLSDSARPPDIVFTTYQTIECEKRNPKPLQASIFSYKWKRIVLDEAHIIRNHKTATARAIASLQATSRWAMSGTPIQNSLTDFLGLFTFLNFKPYDDARAFDNDILDLWRSKPVDEAIDTFKKLLSCIMIRRTKTILELPSRVFKVIRVAFDPQEEEYYGRIERPLAEMLDEAAEGQNNPSGSWLNAIPQINKLRLVCNLGTFVPSHRPRSIQPTNDTSLAVLSARLSMGGQACAQCLDTVGSLPSRDELEDSTSSNVYYSACHRLFCASCSILLRYQTPEPCGCADPSSLCPLLPLSPLLATPRLTPTREASPSRMEMDGPGSISSKVRALLSQIKAYPSEKHVVFSSWTSSLDMVQQALQCDGIRFVRIDGKVKVKKREEAIQQLNKNHDTRVILITISCGACGLDLTAASQVHMLEPQWNPSLEDQAFARVHRLGQTHPVTMLRYVMKNSFEEHVLKVQDRKKLLATTLLSNDSSLDKLQQLLNGK